MFDLSFRYIRPKDLEKMLGISRSKREAMVRDGLLPKPYRLGTRAVAWRSDEVEAAMENFTRVEDAYERSGQGNAGKVIVKQNHINFHGGNDG